MSTSEYVSMRYFLVGRVLNTVVAVAVGQRDEAGAVEVDAVKVNQIRVLVRVHATGVEPNLSLLLVDAVNATHDVIAFRDLVFDFAFLHIDQVRDAASRRVRTRR